MATFSTAGAQASAAIGSLIDGKAVANAIRGEVKQEIAFLQDRFGVKPGLAVVLVGDRPESVSYVKMKKKACVEVGIEPFEFLFPENVDQTDLLAKIKELNATPEVHGILVQLPLPDHVDTKEVLYSIAANKDVDGLHPLNVAALADRTNADSVREMARNNEPTQFSAHEISTSGSSDEVKETVPLQPLSKMAAGADSILVAPPGFHIACTPLGCLELLDRYNVKIEGSRIALLGRSNLVGMPLAMLLMQRNATVTILHSQSSPVDVEQSVQSADIVISATGRPGLVQRTMLKPGCVVVDVGLTYVDDASSKRGYRICGDVDFENAKEVAALITPVPGGVGPMTVAMLLKNSLNAAKRAISASMASSSDAASSSKPTGSAES